MRLFSLLIILLASTPFGAYGQAPLIDGFGGPVSYGTQCLGPNDDGTSRSIDLSSVFPAGVQFFDRNHRSMHVNTNGNITFGEGLGQYTPEAFPVADQPMIAPFWADVDIRSVGCDSDTDGNQGLAEPCENPRENGVWWHLDTDNQRVVVTWDRVGYYQCRQDKRMSFQLILTPVPVTACAMEGDFDVEFRFNRCEWNTGGASGGEDGLAPGLMADGTRRAMCTNIFGTELCPGGNPILMTSPCVDGFCTVAAVPAQSGFDAGNSRDFIEIPTSRTNNIHTNLCTQSNVGEAGIWRFQVRRGSVLCPDAGESCATGGVGVCGIGRTACVGGANECRQDLSESPERCDALDNDCDGTTDEGDLCEGAEVCDRGVCIENCFEFGCLDGFMCDGTGHCVEAACADVNCPAGQRCRGGACVGACDGVVCPGDLSCVGGQCVDTCAGTTCDDCTVCQGGACIERCAEGHCGTGSTCAASGLCVDTGCEVTTCPAGTVCRAGGCIDACMGAVCPAGESCTDGMCIQGSVTGPDAGPGFDGGPAFDGGPGFDGGPAFDAGPAGRRDDEGCGCRVGANSAPSPLLVLFGLMLFVRRQRRR